MLFAVGAGIIVFNWVVPPRLGLAMEFCVALALMAVGLFNLHRSPPDRSEIASGSGRPPARRAFVIGLVQRTGRQRRGRTSGAGDHARPAMGMRLLARVRNGTLLGMALITTGFALPVATVARRWGGAGRLIHVSTGALSLVFGIWLAYHIGWQDGLFLAAPSWTPR